MSIGAVTVEPAGPSLSSTLYIFGLTMPSLPLDSYIILASSVVLYTIYVFYFPRSYNFLSLDIAGTITSERDTFYALPFFESHKSLPILLEVIQMAENDPKIQGIFLRINGVDAGWAKLEELRRAILRFNQKDKTSVVYMDQGNNKDYFLATFLGLTPGVVVAAFFGGSLGEIKSFKDIFAPKLIIAMALVIIIIAIPAVYKIRRKR